MSALGTLDTEMDRAASPPPGTPVAGSQSDLQAAKFLGNAKVEADRLGVPDM